MASPVVRADSLVGVVEVDAQGFASIVLTFGYFDTHPDDGRLLREWVAEIPGASWSKARRAWVIPDANDVPRGALRRAGFTVLRPDGELARPSDFAVPEPEIEPLPEPLPGVPDWFGIEPYEYQVRGADDVVSRGRLFIADEPGVGKTLTALLVAARVRSSRTLILCPPVVVTHWARTTTATGLIEHMDGGPGELVVFRSGRKTPALPERGVVVASASLVAGRPELAHSLEEWQPHLMILDESHEVKTWTSRRARVIRRLSDHCTMSLPLTGTPAPSAMPLELCSQLYVAGMLHEHFGSYLDFRDRYTRKTKWGWAPRRDRLKGLETTLNGLWVRRTKAEVLPDLPPKVRSVTYVDVEIGQYRERVADIEHAIDEWLDEYVAEHGVLPTEDVSAWCSGRGDLVASLREAAGIAKVPAVAEMVRDRLAAHPAENGLWPSPIIVWTHHHSVSQALVEALSDVGATLVDGTTSSTRRDEIFDAYEAGRIPVLVAGILAVGVGVTLVRGNEAFFLELDWNPANVIQAEDRQHRPGQTSTAVFYTSLIAAGTIDERVADVLHGKSGVLAAMMSGDHAQISRAHAKGNPRVFTSTILSEMVESRIQARPKTKKGALAR